MMAQRAWEAERAWQPQQGHPEPGHDAANQATDDDDDDDDEIYLDVTMFEEEDEGIVDLETAMLAPEEEVVALSANTSRSKAESSMPDAASCSCRRKTPSTLCEHGPQVWIAVLSRLDAASPKKGILAYSPGSSTG